MNARPIRMTPEMKLAAALKLVVDIKRDCYDFRNEDSNELAEQIAANADYAYMDGYDLAKRLDSRCGWAPDAMMVEALDNWSVYATAEITAAQRAWLETEKPSPAFKIGDRIQMKHGKTGTITEADDKNRIAQYLVKEDGDEQADGFSQRRVVINWEDAEAIAAENAQL